MFVKKGMKKYYLRVFSVFVAMALFFACKEESASDSSSFSIDQQEIEALSSGGVTLISVSTGLSWNVSSDAEWVKVSPASGTGSGSVTVNIDERTGASRSTKLTFVAGSIVKTVDVLQRGNLKDDYYRTGEIIRMHRHTVGEGIVVVILCDGFDREDCKKGGVLEYNCYKLKDLFLSMPIVRDHKGYFDVIARVDVSRDRGARNCVEDVEHCPDNAYGAGHPDFNWDLMHHNATLAAGKTNREIIYMANGMVGGHVINGIAVYSANEPNKPYWMMHEFVGHTLGRMVDMYFITGSDSATSETYKVFDNGHETGDWLQLDWKTDPKEVYWRDFIGQPGYEQVGVYPASFWDLKFGSLTTCEDINNSVMYGPVNHYTVMERYQLWRIIQSRAGFTTITIDEFKEYDQVNLIDADWSWQRYDNWVDDRIWEWTDD